MDSGYTKEQLEAMGVNTEHLFVFTEVFSIDILIDSLIGVFGPCERIVYGEEYNKGYDHYLWDEIGFVALVSPEKKVMEVSLHWDCLPKVEEYDYNDSDPVPAKFFKGKMLLNGVPLDNTSDYAAYCNNKEVQERLREMARQNGIVKNFDKILYHYSAFEDTPFFSYRVKIATQTGSIHEFGMQYDIYTNPDFTDIF